MKLCAAALLALVAAATGARPRWHQLSTEYTYDQYLRDFGKASDVSASEMEMRRGLFAKRLHEVLLHNSGQSSWKKGINHMSDWTDAERKAIRGYNSRAAAGKSPEELGAVPAPISFAASDIPASIDWRTKGVITPVKDQGHCGSCWAFASTANVESHLAINTGVVAELSPQQLVSCSANSDDCGGFGACSGSIADLAYGFVKQNGLASPYSFPYVSWAGDTNGTCAVSPASRAKAVATLTGFVKVPSNNETAVLAANANAGPLTVNVAAEPWMDYESGVFDGCAPNGSGTDIDHVVQMVGYDADSILIRNSWTPMWGESGYIRLKRTSACGEDQRPQDGTGCSNGPKTVSVCGMCGVLYDATYPTGTATA